MPPTIIDRKLDSSSSHADSVDSAPYPASHTTGLKKSAGGGGLARVTSYNKLERNLEDDSVESQSHKTGEKDLSQDGGDE